MTDGTDSLATDTTATDLDRIAARLEDGRQAWEDINDLAFDLGVDVPVRPIDREVTW